MPRIRSASIALVALCAALFPPSGFAGAQEQDKLERIEDKIDRNQDKIERANERKKGVLADLEESDRRKAGYAKKIRGLALELGEAETRLKELQANLEITRSELVRTTRRLHRSKSNLRDQRERLENRAREAYKLGPGGYLEALLGSQDLRAFADRMAMLDEVLSLDSRMVEGVTLTRTLVADHRSNVDSQEERLDGRWKILNREVERIAALKEQQEALKAEVDREIDLKEALLSDIETQKKKYLEAVADLEAESAALTGEIQLTGSTGSGGSGRLFWPTNGPIVSNYGWRVHPIFGYQRFHAGLDIDGACSQPIYAADHGVVLSAGSSGGYGNLTVVDHGNGLSTAYAHQSQFGASSGQRVTRGEQIGYVGTTGWSTGCHLHFEVRINGQHTDPAPYLS